MLPREVCHEGAGLAAPLQRCPHGSRCHHSRGAGRAGRRSWVQTHTAAPTHPVWPRWRVARSGQAAQGGRPAAAAQEPRGHRVQTDAENSPALPREAFPTAAWGLRGLISSQEERMRQNRRDTSPRRTATPAQPVRVHTRVRHSARLASALPDGQVSFLLRSTGES